MPHQLNNIKQWIPESTHLNSVLENISYLWLSLTNHVQELYRGKHLFCNPEWGCLLGPNFHKTLSLWEGIFLPSTWRWEESKTQGRGIKTSRLFFLASTGAQGKSSHGVASACFPMPLACARKKSDKGCPEHLPPTGFGGWVHWRGGSIPVGWYGGPYAWTNYWQGFLFVWVVSLRVCHEPKIMNNSMLCTWGAIGGKKKKTQVKDLV